jgi:predicted RNase H-like HicB family nuclease
LNTRLTKDERSRAYRFDIIGEIPIKTEMKTFTAIVEKDPDTKLYVGYVPGFPGAHSQGETLDELQENLREVIEMLLEGNEQLMFQTEFVGTQQIVIQSA